MFTISPGYDPLTTYLQLAGPVGAMVVPASVGTALDAAGMVGTVTSPTAIFTQKVFSIPMPSGLPAALRSSKIPVYTPSLVGAMRSTETFTVDFGAVAPIGAESGAPIR